MNRANGTYIESYVSVQRSLENIFASFIVSYPSYI